MTLPHSDDPIIDVDGVSLSGVATFEMAAWMQSVLQKLEPVTTTDFTNAASGINTIDKAAFTIAANSTTTRIVYASGGAPTDTWLNFDGTTAHTPA